VVAERPTYFGRAIGAAGPVASGSVGSGVVAPATEWLFAEGSTRDGIQTYLSVQNPGDVPAHVDVYLPVGSGDAGTVNVTVVNGHFSTTSITVAPHTRQTVDVDRVLGPGHDAGAIVNSDQSVVVERPVYFH